MGKRWAGKATSQLCFGVPISLCTAWQPWFSSGLLSTLYRPGGFNFPLLLLSNSCCTYFVSQFLKVKGFYSWLHKSDSDSKEITLEIPNHHYSFLQMSKLQLQEVICSRSWLVGGRTWVQSKVLHGLVDVREWDLLDKVRLPLSSGLTFDSPSWFSRTLEVQT